MYLKICLCCGQAMNGRQSSNLNTCLDCDAMPSFSEASGLAVVSDADLFEEPTLSRNAPGWPHVNSQPRLTMKNEVS